MESKSTNWIWLRGLIREQGHWYDFENEFRKHFLDVKVECLDLPGNGARCKEVSPTTIEANTEAVRKASELLGQGERPFILSISLGAMVAIDWAYRYPEEIQGVVCINTSLREHSSFMQRLKPGNYLRILKFLMDQDQFSKELRILQMTSQRRTDLKSLAERACKLAEEHPISRANVVRQLTAAARFTAPKQKARRPFLFLNSLRDTLVDSRCTEQAAKLVGGDLMTHPTAGHDLALDDGAWVADRIHEWVESLGSR